eukprot:GILK01014826.1.p1 GENE.GILK01014826.1~~GILK01014826.1.p1  ORF type:complete len:287 (+),score=20.34 GILK01014826.1:151-1011(+)
MYTFNNASQPTRSDADAFILPLPDCTSTTASLYDGFSNRQQPDLTVRNAFLLSSDTDTSRSHAAASRRGSHLSQSLDYDDVPHIQDVAHNAQNMLSSTSLIHLFREMAAEMSLLESQTQQLNSYLNRIACEVTLLHNEVQDVRGSVRTAVESSTEATDVQRQLGKAVTKRAQPGTEFNNVSPGPVGASTVGVPVEPRTRCEVCGTSSTPQWRKDEGRRVCNACGLLIRIKKRKPQAKLPTNVPSESTVVSNGLTSRYAGFVFPFPQPLSVTPDSSSSTSSTSKHPS